MTPQQMRELADLGPLIHIESWDTVCAALRTAADQLDALNEFPHDCVCQWPHGDDHPEAYGNYCSCWKSVLTAGTARQDGDNA